MQPIARRDGTEVPPASPAQRRLWTLHQLSPESSGSNRPLALRLRGPLDRSALSRALDEIVRRHEALRTVFEEIEGEPVQRIRPAASLPLPLIELAEGAQEPEAAARGIVAQEAGRPFDLSRGPLIRPMLLRLGNRDHVLLLLMHHVVFDGWSETVLIEELAALYAAFADGRASPLPDPPIQYADFALWQRDRLASGTLDAQLAYWRRCIGPLPPSLDLSFDFPPLEDPPSRGAEHVIALGDATTARLKSWCRRERVTPFTALLAAYQGVLGRYTHQNRFLVGVPIAGRSRAETSGLIGCFMNVIVMPVDLSSRPSYRQLVLRNRELILEAHAHADLPIERLVQSFQRERRRPAWPIFDVLFNMRNMPRCGEVTAGDLRIEAFPFEQSAMEGPSLYLAVEELGGNFECTFRYATDVFRPATIHRMAEHFRRFLEAALDDPDRELDALPLVTSEERSQLVERWNETGVADPEFLPVHEMIAAQARRTPDAPAVLSRAAPLTYQDLDQRANQLAHYLREIGVGPESRVAVLLDRSTELVTAIVAILKAGGAYIPLDPSAAFERSKLALEDAGSAVLLTTTDLAAPASATRVVLLDAAQELIRRRPRTAPGGATDPDQLAYVMFTSGSTGRPKGAMVSHRALRSHLRWRVSHFGYSPADRVLHSAALAFDDALWETFTPLVSGGSILLVNPGEERDPRLLLGAIREGHATVACFVPSLLAAVLDVPGLAECTSLRVVDTGGEALTRELQDRFHERLPIDLFNGYGPAETTIASSFWRCERGGPSLQVPIGRPVDNTRMYLLDGRLEPVPIGVVGELYIGGEGVARGYINRPGATAPVFVPDPFGPPGSRLFRTGDLARYRPDGALEFLGRRDLQIKIRGHRIELEEIEAVLRSHRTVRDAAVIVRRDSARSPALVGYVVLAGPERDWGELRGFLHRRLPEAMIPAAFVTLDALPLTSSGKLDRQALPLDAAFEPEVDYVAPRTALEARLAEIWSTLLGRSPVGVHDDFFSLGGHSLLALQLVSQIRSALGVELPLIAVFEASSLGRLAERIATAPTAEVEVDDEGSKFMFPTSYLQRSLWLLDRLYPGSAAYVMPQAYHLAGPLDVAALQRALQDVVDRHEVLRTTFAEVDGIPMQIADARLEVPFSVEDAPGESPVQRRLAARRLLAEEATTPFDLSRGPLIRARLMRIGPSEHLLCVSMHHIVSDGWSLGVFARELDAHYAARTAGQAASLPDLPIQYADFSVWQHEWLQGPLLARQLGYWRERLAGAPPVLRLPTDRPRPPVQRHRGARRTLLLEPALAQALGTLSRAEGSTLFMTLLSAFGLLLARYSGQRDLVIGTPIAGRTRTELEGLIGFFINTLALRLDLGGRPSFRELLARVREVALGAYGHQELPFERLVEELQPERTLQHHPLFQVLFQLLNIPPRNLRLGDLEVTPFGLDKATSKFDLSVAVHETPEGLRCYWTFDADLFDGETIGCLLAQYRTLLLQIANDPDGSIEGYSLVSDACRAVIPDPTLPFEATRYPSFPELFAARVAATPDAVAVEDSARHWTYAELDAVARRISVALGASAVGRGDRVAVSGPASPGLVASAVAVLRAGGVLVPIDPALPERRREALLAGASVRLLLDVGGGLPAPSDARCERLQVEPATGDIPGLRPDTGAGEWESNAPAPSDPAYVFFTSGTTGTPKGVLGVHGALGHFLEWEREAFGIGAGDRIGLLANISFDVVLRDLFLPLSSGATLVLPPGDRAPEALLGWLAATRITVLHVVPTIAEAWLDAAASPPATTSLRWVLFAGEALNDVLVRRWRRLMPEGGGVANLYGPTEVTMVKSFHIVPGEPQPGVQPVGRPLPQTQALVLNEADGMCGVGESGEIAFRTPYLTLGYLTTDGDQPGQGFGVNPFRLDPADRIYRTGDLGRYRLDGVLVWNGRRDHQLKISGVRVEPDEVGGMLAGHPKVRACSVVGRRENEQTTLAAFVVAEDGVGGSELRAWLAERLPAVMIPSAFVFLPELPLSPNGKVDRRALPSAKPLEDHVDFTPPRTELESRLLSIWREVLGVDQLSVHDSFFSFGGHSLLATRVIARIRSNLGVDIPPSVMFDSPTIAGLAAAIAATNSP